MNNSRWLVVTAVLAACATPDPVEPSARRELDQQSPVALYSARRYASGWVLVVEMKQISFRQSVTVHYQASDGAWLDREFEYLYPAGDTSLLFVDQLPALEPLRFAIHDQLYFSGGTGSDAWDNNHGADYRAGEGDVPIGPGMNIAVTDLAVVDGRLTGEVVVRNIVPDKVVRITYSTDGWHTVREVEAHYVHGGTTSGGVGELWRFEVALDAAATFVDLAAMTEQNGVQSWDNNFESNYACWHQDAGWQCRGRALLACTADGCQRSEFP